MLTKILQDLQGSSKSLPKDLAKLFEDLGRSLQKLYLQKLLIFKELVLVFKDFCKILKDPVRFFTVDCYSPRWHHNSLSVCLAVFCQVVQTFYQYPFCTPAWSLRHFKSQEPCPRTQPNDPLCPGCKPESFNPESNN